MVAQSHYMHSLATISPKIILVLGDLILDKYTYGSSKRISPEAPVPIVLVDKRELLAGGAGNVALNLKALGMIPRLVTRIGDDESGKLLQSVLHESHINCEYVVTDSTMSTTVKTRIIAGSQQLMRIDEERVSSLGRSVEDRLIDEIETIFDGVEVLAISDYAKGMLTDRLLAVYIDYAKKNDIPCITDPKGIDFLKYSGSTIIKPNASEAIAVFGAGAKSLDEAARIIFNRIDLDLLLVTRSEKGISLYYPDGQEELYPVVPKAVRDVTGAGDTVLAVLATALSAKIPLQDAVPLANIAAACSIERLGCAAITLKDIVIRLLDESPTGKICRLETLRAMIRSMQEDTIVLIQLQEHHSISHEQIMSLHKLLLEKAPSLFTVVYIDHISPDEQVLEFLASLDKVRLVVHKSHESDSLSEFSEQVEIILI